MKKAISLMTAAMLTAAVNVPVCAVGAELKDSGIDYSELVETIGNPGMGYTGTVWANCKPGSTPVYDPTGELMLFFVNIGGFSSGINGDADYDLDEDFFAAWDTTLENCRKNGCMAALRFRYDDNGKDDPEPETFEQVLRNVSQLKESGLFEKYADILAFVECGFVGKWGEQHGGKYTSVQHKARLLEAMLEAVPAPIPVTVRTPDIFAEWAGIKRAELNDAELIDSLTESRYTTDVQKNRRRIGLYNDGYMGSDSDLGTYADRAKETEWLSRQTLTSYFGGEFSGNIDFAKKYETYLPENAIPEMYKTHLSYINGNIFQLYKDYTFGADYDVDGADNSAYYGQTVYQFIRDHLGYRFVLRDSDLTPQTVQGGEVEADFKVENTGFANVIPQVQSYVILEKDGEFMLAGADTDCRGWLSQTVSDSTLRIKLPDSIPAGEWKIYLKLSMGTPSDVRNMNSRSIRFANSGVWESVLGANYLGSVEVTEAAEKGTDNTLRAAENADNTPNQMYSTRGGTVVDGMHSSAYEWTDDMLVSEGDNGLKLYAKADDKNFYIMSNVTNNAGAPVYNLQFKRADGESFWLYYASNGFVYYNHGDYSGCRCKWSGDMVEFCVPLRLVGLTDGAELTNLRIFMQDSADEWKLMSDVTAPSCTVSSDIRMISAKTDLRLKIGEKLTYDVLAELDGAAEYQWLHDGEIVENADSATFAIENVSTVDSGEYTVKITTAEGIEKTAAAFALEVVGEKSDYIAGDANCDGYVTVADATLILQTIGNGDKYKLLKQGKLNADVDETPGISAIDALVIQQTDAGIYDFSELPLKKK